MPIAAIVDTLDAVDEKYRDLYSEKNGKFEVTGVTGYKTQADVDRVQEGLKKEREDHKASRERLGLFGDIDPEGLHEQLDRIGELEAAAADKIDESKINEMVETRLKTKMSPVVRDLEAKDKALAEATGVIQQYQEKERIASIHDTVREAGKLTHLLSEAEEDALLLAERVFEVDEDGNVTAKDGVGCTPGVTPEVWLQEMQPKRPHWWGPSAGGGARPGDKGFSGTNPWAAETWNMTEQNAIYTKDATRATQLATAAGTTIGGLKPAKTG